MQNEPSKPSQISSVPRHVAIIMDGNGRWASSRKKARHSGHRAGVKSVRLSVETAAQRGVEYLTLFAFSSENWARPVDEVGRLMSLFVEALRREVDELHRNNVRLNFVGAREQLNKGLREKITEAEKKTANNNGLRLTVAIAYGGRWDIIEATKAIARRVESGSLTADAIDEAEFVKGLQLADVPDPDLLIRTGGETRISNFLLWNLAYAELWFTDVLWPEFDANEFDNALAYFASRQRRFGNTGEQVEAVGC
ncbi:MAG: isoprenyl transferase [Gammaproteobacteria bacterium]|nr:MAG: isoprenyl transferase [Gammaproteobacteria bacterium]